jgi:hypothetical protein
MGGLDTHDDRLRHADWRTGWRIRCVTVRLGFVVDEHGLSWRRHLQSQSQVTSRGQAFAAGWSRKAIAHRLESGRWYRLQRGSYATFTGDPPRDATLWAALLRAGSGAVLSHETAAEVHGFAREPCGKIHISIPAERHPARNTPIPGAIVHRRRVLEPAWTPPWELPRTTAADTVLDLIDAAETFDDAYGWICRALGRRAISVFSLREALAQRKRIRWRTLLAEALDDADEGINSPLERRYVHGVERPHGLPSATRQAKRRVGSRNIYLDNLYEPYGVCVELDGAATHPAEGRWQDTARDNANLIEDDTRTVRYGWTDVTASRCATAIAVARLLRKQGWTGRLRRCGPACPVARA